MLVKYCLSDNINIPFENFVLGVRNVWVGLPTRPIVLYVYNITNLGWANNYCIAI